MIRALLVGYACLVVGAVLGWMAKGQTEGLR